jgi:hypothetical protein
MEDSRGWLMLISWAGGLWFTLSVGGGLEGQVRTGAMSPRSAERALLARTSIALIGAITLVACVELFPEKGGDMGGFFTLAAVGVNSIVVGIVTLYRAFAISSAGEA